MGDRTIRCTLSDVAGGTFISKVKNNITEAPAFPSDFRMIRLGDIDLRREIRLNRRTGVVERQRRCIRSVYSARIEGRNSDMTVALDQGDGAEEFYDFRQVRDLYRYSHFATVHFWTQAQSQFSAASTHFELLSRTPLFLVGYKAWIRCSTGQLSLEVMAHQRDSPFIGGPNIPNNNIILTVDSPNLETDTIDCLTLEHYQEFCSTFLARHQELSTPRQITVTLGEILVSSSKSEKWVAIATLADPELYYRSWGTFLDGVSETRIEGWTWFSHPGITKIYAFAGIRMPGRGYWLAQAIHMFSRLGITSNYEDYVFVDYIHFNLHLSAITEKPPEGYLFLCPVSDLQISQSSFRWPECPAYRSLNASGTERLSSEEATDLGFPSIELTMTVCAFSWDESVYAGLRTFHRGKGFDPDSLDVAHHLGYPPFQVSSQPNLQVVEEPSAGEHDEAAARENQENSSVFDASGEHKLHCKLGPDFDVRNPGAN
ncbi:hypothetical protein DFH09DRAFT_1303037 [Mycena vulgaris]|nr:hypothetical protein DFH09DRAFT_1303037 [Mycena vulgaris]